MHAQRSIFLDKSNRKVLSLDDILKGFEVFNGKKQNTVIGGMSPNGRILYGMSGATGNPTSIFIKSAMTPTQLGQIQFFNNGSNSYYSTAQKPQSGTNGEIVPNAPK